MKSFKYFTREGDVYIKTPQRVLYYTVAVLLIAVAIWSILYVEGPKGRVTFGLFGLLGLIIFLRGTASSRFNIKDRTITAYSFFFMPPKVFSFDDFDHFLVNKQSYMGFVIINATATIIMKRDGKQRVLLLHQSMFVTRPLQRVIDEVSQIMGINDISNSY